MRLYGVKRVTCALMVILVLMLSGCSGSTSDTKPNTDNAKPNTDNTKPNTEASSATNNALPETVGIGTVPVGGAFYMVGTGLAKVINDYSPIKAIVKPMAGANAFNPLLESGELQLGIQGMDVSWAYNGGPGYEKKPLKNIRMLIRGNDVPVLGLVVRVDSGINSIKDLKGKRVASGYGGFQVGHQATTAYLESAGLTWDDVKAVPVAAPTAIARAIQEGRIDAGFGGAATAPDKIEINQATPIKALDYGDILPNQIDNAPQEPVQILQKYLPGARMFVQKKEGFLKSDGTQITYPMMLTASAKLSADAAYEITKTLYENDKELHPLHPYLKGWTKETMFDPNPSAPYHEGTVRFWKEKGLWTPEAEANQKKLIGQ